MNPNANDSDAPLWAVWALCAVNGALLFLATSEHIAAGTYRVLAWFQ